MTDKLTEAWAELEALPYLMVTGTGSASEREQEKGIERARADQLSADTGWYIDGQALREKARALMLAVLEEAPGDGPGDQKAGHFAFVDRTLHALGPCSCWACALRARIQSLGHTEGPG